MDDVPSGTSLRGPPFNSYCGKGLRFYGPRLPLRGPPRGRETEVLVRAVALPVPDLHLAVALPVLLIETGYLSIRLSARGEGQFVI